MRIAPALRQVGIRMTFTRGRVRTIEIRQSECSRTLPEATDSQQPTVLTADEQHFADADEDEPTWAETVAREM